MKTYRYVCSRMMHQRFVIFSMKCFRQVIFPNKTYIIIIMCNLFDTLHVYLFIIFVYHLFLSNIPCTIFGKIICSFCLKNRCLRHVVIFHARKYYHFNYILQSAGSLRFHQAQFMSIFGAPFFIRLSLWEAMVFPVNTAPFNPLSLALFCYFPLIWSWDC